MAGSAAEARQGRSPGPAPAEQAKQVEEPGIRAFSLVDPREIARRIGRELLSLA